VALIQASELSKHFKVSEHQEGRFAAVRNLFSLRRTERVAVDKVTFAIERGEMVGYVGPNGAGKSTTIKMLTGILTPTSGRAEVAGLVPHRDRKQLARHIGVVFGQKTQLWWDVPVSESLRLLKEIYRIPARTYAANLELFDDLLDLYDFQHVPVRQLSLGQRMRADLAAALLHNPDILFLDEPTIGVDVVAKDRFRSFIRQLNAERQVTVMLTTHDMSDIEKICERMVIIDKGRVIYDGAIEDLRRRFAPYRVLVVDFADDADLDRASADLDCGFVANVEIAQADLLEREGRRCRFRFDRRRVSASELIAQLVSEYPVKDVSVEEPEIEAVVREIYEDLATWEQLDA
jgi:ABC-2 type transport system ATP-binding protein